MTERRITVPPPHTIDHPEIRAAVTEYNRLYDALTASQTKLTQLREDHRRMLEGEASDHAAAIRAGKADPGVKRSTKLAAEIDTEVRTIEALERAVGEARRELGAAVGEHREAWQATLTKRRAEARARYLDAVTAVEVARVGLGEAFNLTNWVAAFPGPAKWAPGAYFTQVPSPVAQAANPLTIESVLDALRTLGAPPVPRPVVEHVPPGGRQNGNVPRSGVAQREAASGALHVSARPVVTVETGDGPTRAY